MSSLERYVADDPAEDPGNARRALRELPEDELVPVVVTALEHLRRAQVRVVEQLVVHVAVTGPEPEAEPVRVQVELTPEARKLLPLEIALGGGRRVTYGEATVEQLAQRKALYQQQIDGNRAKVRQLDEMIEVLTRTGARCLNELL